LKTTAAIFCLVLVTTLLVVSHARQIQFTNECPFQLNVEATPGGVVCGLNQGASCTWQIPASGWSGNFHRQDNDGILGYPSATLAEFTLGSNAGGEWDWDWYDISIIPPGCGSGTSYDGCWCTTGRDGYDVGMTVQPLSPTGCETRTCLNRDCAGAYGYPSDSSKTTTCKDITGNWHITFCPPGSFIDVGATAVSQTPPCDGGSATPPATKSPPPPAKKSPPPPAKKSPSSKKSNAVVDSSPSILPSDISSSPAPSDSSFPSWGVALVVIGTLAIVGIVVVMIQVAFLIRRL